MGTTYKQGDVESVTLMEDVRDEFHPGLVEARARVCLMFAYAARDEDTGEPVGPALKLHGTPALAIAKINNLARRAEGMADATITVDGDQWPGWGDDRRRALLDHELHHLVVRRGKTREVLTDNLGRPKIAMRPHDFEVGWFDAVARRHGRASVECEQARRLVDADGQLLFPWAPDAGQRPAEAADKPAAGRKRAAAKGGPSPRP